MVRKLNNDILAKAARITLLLTDCDGVLTDGGVFYSENGEAFKKFNIRDGMGVERLKTIAAVETGIISGERSLSLAQRAKKLAIRECHLGVKDKPSLLHSISQRLKTPLDTIAYIGDDVNDFGMFEIVGLSACPNDAMGDAKDYVDWVCERRGGQGAFREFAEMIITARIHRN